MTQGQRDINRKLKILRHAEETRNIAMTCRYFGISREIFYQWKRTYAAKGDAGLINSKPCPENPKLRFPADIEEKILYLRQTYHLGAMRISWYLERYHGMKVSSGGVYGVLKRNGLNRLPQNARKRTVTKNSFRAIIFRWMLNSFISGISRAIKPDDSSIRPSMMRPG